MAQAPQAKNLRDMQSKFQNNKRVDTAENKAEIFNRLGNELLPSRIAMQFPKQLRGEESEVRAKQWISSIKNELNIKPTLAACTPDSVIGGLLLIAQLGLEPGPIGLIYLVPMWNKDITRYEMSVIVGYRGYMELMRRSGDVMDIDAVIVYEKDKFFFAKKSVIANGRLMYINELLHEPYMESADRGDKKCVYATVNLKSGDAHIERMMAYEVEKIKASTKSKSKEGVVYGPWADHEEEMWRKTIARRLYKWTSSSREITIANSLDNLYHVQESQNLSSLANNDDVTEQLNALQTRLNDGLQSVEFEREVVIEE